MKETCMASAAEQMAANVSWGAFGKATELRQRIFFTIGLLIVYRIGTYIPVPGIDGNALRDFMEQAAAGHRRRPEHVHRRRDQPDGHLRARHHALHLGLDHRAALTAMVPLEQLKKEGEQGRKKINQYTRYGTVLLATFQAYGLAVSLEAGGSRDRSGLVLPRLDRHHAGRRHDVPDVAGRADHRARRRQRHLADHLRRHHRRASGRACPVLRTGAVGRALDGGDHRRLG
jgi:hypothetical protein